MFTKFTLTLVSLILLFSLTGCGAKATVSPTAGTSDADNYQMLPVISGKVANMKVDSSADGTTQQLKKGEVLEVSLESNPSTGYAWYAKISDANVIVQMGEPQYQEPSSNSAYPLMGAAGKQVFLFQASNAGMTTITLEYMRSWEVDVAPEKTINITVVVQ